LYVVLITSRKLCYYFDTYPIEVVTEFSLGDILHNKDTNEHIIKWWSLAHTHWNFKAT
jgi:hypothetical protein